VFPASQKSGWLAVFPLSGTGPGTVYLVAAAPAWRMGPTPPRLVFQSANTTPAVRDRSGDIYDWPQYRRRGQRGVVPPRIRSGHGLSVFWREPGELHPNAYALPLPPTMAGVSATVNGIAAPLYYVSPGQLNIQIPYETAIGTGLSWAVGNNGQVATYSFPVSASAPGIYLQSGNAITP